MTRKELEKEGYTFRHRLSTATTARVSIELFGEPVDIISHVSRPFAYKRARERALADFVMRRLAGEIDVAK